MIRSLRGSAALALSLSPFLSSAEAAPQDPAADAKRAERLADLDFLERTIRERHPEPLRRRARELWAPAAAALRERAAELSDARFWFELSSLVALLEDGHTTLVPSPAGIGAHSFPLELEFFADGLHVLAADRRYAEAVGGRVVSIGGRPIDEVLAAARPAIPGDNPQGQQTILEMALAMPCVHEALGLSGGLASRIEVEDARGVRREVALAPPEPGPPAFLGPRPSSWVGAEPAEPPLRDREPAKPYFVEYLEPQRCVYVRLRRVEQDEGERIAAFCRRVGALVEERAAERLVIDLRGNRGGNNYLTQPLVHAVIKSRLNEPGRVYVLIDGETFSAAQNCASFLERETWALFVGSPSGGSPNHCGDAETFVLPGSGHLLFCSTVRWQDSDPRDERRWTYPDVPAPLAFADLAAGRDPAIEAALRHELAPIEGYTGLLPRAHWQRATQRDAWPPR